MKTQGMAHQLEALRLSNGREHFAYLMEQGTGKTWTALADAERAYTSGQIDAVLVFAPNGVHTNWIRRELPAHLGVAWVGGAYRSGAGKRETEALESALFRPRPLGEVAPLRFLAINSEAIITDTAFALASRFINATRCMVIVDESSDFKSMDAARTKRLLRLRDRSAARRILNGTPITNSPGDAFAQFEFLGEGLLGTTSYRAFFSEYAELMQMDSARLIAEGNWAMAQRLKRNPALKHSLIVRRDESGRPVYRNLDKLRALVGKHSYRVLKRECLDLPPKVYQTHYFDMPPAQRAAYESVKKDARMIVDGELLRFVPLAVLTKMQQVTSGFVLVEGEPRYVDEAPGAKTRLAALETVLEHVEGKVIIWAKFVEELAQIARLLARLNIGYVSYHGGTKRAEREAAVDLFQEGTPRVFLGQPRAGGIGLTLTAAETTIYFSNDFNLRTRLQSEDRNHRIGTKNHVTYIDLVATDSIDESIARALQRKTDVAAEILGDSGLRFSEGDLQADAPVDEAQEAPSVALWTPPAVAEGFEGWKPGR